MKNPIRDKRTYGSSRINRGGDWDIEARENRVIARDSDTVDYKYEYRGFRLVRTKNEKSSN